MIESFEHGTYLLGHHIEEIISDERCEGSCIGTLNDITDSHGETIKSGRSRYIGQDGMIMQHTTWLGHECIYFLLIDSNGIIDGYIHPSPGNIHVDGDTLIYTSKTHKYIFTVKKAKQ